MRHYLVDLAIGAVVCVVVGICAVGGLELLGLQLAGRQSLVATVAGVFVASIVMAARERQRNAETHDAPRRTRLP